MAGRNSEAACSIYTCERRCTSEAPAVHAVFERRVYTDCYLTKSKAHAKIISMNPIIKHAKNKEICYSAS